MSTLNCVTWIFLSIAIVFLTGMDGCSLEDDPEPALFILANPPNGSTIEPDTQIVATFNTVPLDPSVTTGQISYSGNKVTITGPFAPGPLHIGLFWDGGVQTLSYTVKHAAEDLIGTWHIESIDGENLKTAFEADFEDEDIDLVKLTVNFVFTAERSFTYEWQIAIAYPGPSKELGLEEVLSLNFTARLQGTYVISSETLTLTLDDADLNIEFIPKDLWEFFMDFAGEDIETYTQTLEDEFTTDFLPNLDDLGEFTWDLQGNTLTLIDVKRGEKTVLRKQ